MFQNEFNSNIGILNKLGLALSDKLKYRYRNNKI